MEQRPRLCLYKRFFGIPCPGCGLTRAFQSLLSGDLRKAFYYHPLWWALPLLLGAAARSGGSGGSCRLARAVARTLGGAFLLVYAARLAKVMPGTASIWE